MSWLYSLTVGISQPVSPLEIPTEQIYQFRTTNST